jgi:hypothetical protein
VGDAGGRAALARATGDPATDRLAGGLTAAMALLSFSAFDPHGKECEAMSRRANGVALACVLAVCGAALAQGPIDGPAERTATADAVLDATSISDLAGSVYLVERYGSGKQIMDLYHDGVDDLDFYNWLATGPLSDAPIDDLDGSGAIDEADARLLLAAALAVYSGDHDHDDAVDADDVGLSIVEVGGTSIHGEVIPGDIDADGDVDLDDIQLTATQSSSFYDQVHLDIAAKILEVSEDGPSSGGGPGPDYSSIYEPPNHSQGVSSTYPGHIFGYSKQPVIPNDHDFGISTTWPISDHDGFKSRHYPPNHYATISNRWRWPDDDSHNYSVSVANPPHALSSSKYWPPNHVMAVSGGWYPPETPPLERHAIQSSRTWPPNHTTENSSAIGEHDEMWSLNVPRSDHLTEFSGTWDHNPELSGIAWPPSHIQSPSSGWPDSHTANTSIYWPGNHLINASGTWPHDTDTNWPPNHMLEFSNSWSQPGPGVPLFPPGHSIWTTANEIKDALPLP